MVVYKIGGSPVQTDTSSSKVYSVHESGSTPPIPGKETRCECRWLAVAWEHAAFERHKGVRPCKATGARAMKLIEEHSTNRPDKVFDCAESQ